jgi:hypothetical protein
MMKTEWTVDRREGRLVVTRIETPMWMWLVDRWLRVPDAVFDRIEYRFPSTGLVTRVPCLLYARWFPELVMRRRFTEYDATERREVDMPPIKSHPSHIRSDSAVEGDRRHSEL